MNENTSVRRKRTYRVYPVGFALRVILLGPLALVAVVAGRLEAGFRQVGLAFEALFFKLERKLPPGGGDH